MKNIHVEKKIYYIKYKLIKALNHVDDNSLPDVGLLK